MENIFTLVGIVCALLVSAGILVHGLNAYQHNEAADYYRGLRDQISETIAGIAENYDPQEPMSASAVRMILGQLNNRYTPNLADVKSNDERNLKSTQGLMREALAWIENSQEPAPSLCGDIRKALGMPANAELCGGPSGPSERAPGYALAPNTEE